MRCDEARTLLSTRRDLPPTLRAELELHLGGCRACAAARREEEHTTRLLALLPAGPDVAVPARVRAAVQTMATRSRRSKRLRGGAILAASLGATALIAALLLNTVTGGRLLGANDVGTAAQPLVTAAPAPTASPQAQGELLYLVHQPGDGPSQLIAWEPGPDRTLFSVRLGEPISYTLEDPRFASGRVEVILPPTDVALSVDRTHLFVIEHSGGNDDVLVAYDARSGNELWRTTLRNFERVDLPQTGSYEENSSISVSPDGSQLFVRSVSLNDDRRSGQMSVTVERFDARTGRSVGEPVELPPDTVYALPLNNEDLLTTQAFGLSARVNTTLPAGRDIAWLDQSISLAAPVPMPGPSALYGLTPDLKILEVDLLGGGLDVAAEVDLVPRGAFFFDRAAFSHDGQTLTVGQTMRAPQTRLATSEVRIYGAGPWRALFAPLRYDRPLVDLAVSADGERIYIALGPAGNRANATPIGAVPAERAALLTLHMGSGTITARPLDPAIVGIVAGR